MSTEPIIKVVEFLIENENVVLLPMNFSMPDLFRLNKLLEQYILELEEIPDIQAFELEILETLKMTRKATQAVYFRKYGELLTKYSKNKDDKDNE